jgi:signal transduction histidine kinase/ligand-binding sensor domain-containing protein
MKSFLALVAIGTLNLLLRPSPVLALDPSLDVSQYAHTAWTVRDGFSLGNIYAIAQTPDGYLWLGSEFGLFHFDGAHAVPWHPPAGQHLPAAPYSLLVTRDGTLWIGTFKGLVSWSGGKLTQYPEISQVFVTSLLEDREGTVWAGILGSASDTPTGRLCAIRSGHAQCYGEDGAFGTFVWSLSEDGSGAIWAGAESGLWRWKPGPPKRYPTPGRRVDDLSKTDDGQLLIAIRGAGLKQVVGDKVETYPIRSAINPNALLPDREIDSNKLLRDRDGGLWIGTHERGLIHIHNGRTDVFTKSNGLSGNISCSLFEDREGNIWVATTGGLERFRELAVTTISAEQGLSSDHTRSVLAATDGSIWVAAHDGLTEWKNGRTTIFRKANGLPDDAIQSLFQDDRGRIWVSTDHGLAYLKDDRFVAVNGVPSEEVYSITGDKAGNLWLSGNRGLSHMRDGRLVEHFPWSALGRHQQAKVVLFDPERGGVWLSFWTDGGVLYFKDGQVRASYTAADGLGKGPVARLRLDRDGAVWAAIQEGGGLSRIKDGRIATLTTKNGLPCDTIHWSIEDDDGSLWLYTACGLVRVTRAELGAWITDPNRKIQITVWDAADGVGLREVSPAYFGPSVAKATDGKLWFLPGEGVGVVDPHHLAYNKLPPPVHIEQIVADHKTYWQNSPGVGISNVRLPALTRDLWIDYAALSLVAPEKVRFKYKLEGQDRDWREVVNDREVQYSNLAPGVYRFRVIACNNSGVWNEAGDALDFSIAPAYYQTNWFRVLCGVFLLVLLWAAYQFRVRHLQREFALTLEARVGERIRIARDLHDTLLQSFHAVLLRLQTVSQLLRERRGEAQDQLDSTIEEVAEAITEGRDAVQGLRESTVQSNDLALAISTLGEELATDSNGDRPQFRVAVEGAARNLHPILRDEIYRIAAEALRNAFRHAHARTVEVEVRYDNEQFRLRVRDDGKGIDPVVLSSEGVEMHFGLRGMRERAKLIGGKLVVWSKVDAGTEVELRISAGTAYTSARRASWLSRALAGKAKGDLGDRS